MADARPRPDAPVPTGGAPPPGFGEEAPGAQALDRVLKESEYRPRLEGQAAEILRLERRWRQGVAADLSRLFCVRVVEEAGRLETALLDLGARGNRLYASFVEVVGAARWTALALHALLHLKGRVARYLGARADLVGLRAEIDECVRWLGGRLGACLEAARGEAEGPLGLAAPQGAAVLDDAQAQDVRWRLPQDLHVVEAADQRDQLADLATAFLSIADDAERLRAPVGGDAAARETFARDELPPTAAHELRVRVHGVQSAYDWIVAGTAEEGGEPRLRAFRGYVSILLHLLEATAYLLQLHARLAHDLRSARVRARVEPVLSAADVLRWAVGFLVPSAQACFREARALAGALLERYTRTREAEFDLPPGRKLHLRPAGLIARVVQHHGLPVEMGMGDQSVDARQLMDVILLAASHPNATKVRFRGDERPLADLRLLFEARLGEEGLDALPAALGYLRGPSRGT